MKNAPKLTFEKAKSLIGTLPWICDIDSATGRVEISRPHDTTTTTETWTRAISTDVPLPKGFDVDTRNASYVDIDGHWYRIRLAGITEGGPGIASASSSPS